MLNEHEALIEEYQKYKDEVAEHEKKLYLYNSKIDEYGRDVLKYLSELKSRGVDVSTITSLAEDDGTIDLTNREKVKQMIDAVYSIYQSTIQDGLKVLKDRNNL